MHVIVTKLPAIPSYDGPVLRVSYFSIDDISLLIFLYLDFNNNNNDNNSNCVYNTNMC